jgi:hypothetical protein
MYMEIWKDINGYEGFYQASNYGRIRSVDRIIIRKLPNKADRICKQSGKIIKPMINKGTRKGVKPRYELRLSKNGETKGYQVHRLIAITFYEFDETYEVNHKDGNPLNNHIDNLEVVPRIENIRHAFQNRLINTSFPVLKIDVDTKEVLAEYYSVSDAARTIPISQGSLRFHLEKYNEEPYKGFVWKYKYSTRRDYRKHANKKRK